MRIVVIQRSAHPGDVLRTRDGAGSLPWSSVVEVLDRHEIPDGLPFIVDDDGSLTGYDRLNTYLLAAWRQRAYDLLVPRESASAMPSCRPSSMLRPTSRTALICRTKRQIEAITGRSHDAVAHAFVQDRIENSSYRLSARFEQLTANLTRGDSLNDAAVRKDRQTIAELRQKNRDLHDQLDRFVTALFARHLDTQTERPEIELVTRIRRGQGGE
ncbi:hypothetical protein [Mycobacteroides chelonae]|uniref:hypothetical protein n=1 Tax=Mycobacteroides chelonae TaxID=1774 RepID=UPI000AA900C8|nr:hypothetical protein [Mycobacteroides chelonae]